MAQDEDLRIFFQEVDADKSGSINEEELQAALAAGNLQFNKPIIAQMIKMYDRDQNGSMSYEEFVNLHKFLSVVQNSFEKHARNRQFLELNSVYLALQDAGYSLDEPAFYTACQSFDQKKSGKFRLDDFISVCIFLQSARNLFGAFDTRKEGRIALDFNQLVYCAANLRL